MRLKVIAGILLIILTLSLYCFKNFISADSQHIEVNNLTGNTSTKEQNSINDVTQIEGLGAKSKYIIVDIGGAVAKPGILELPINSRVYTAIEKAGGLAKEADTKRINLAAPINDGEKIYIPKLNEESEQPQGINAKGLININTADSETLQKINGVGPSTAEKIISYRTSNGEFRKIEEIMNVTGIGEKTFAKFKNQISIN